jgi:crotonobetainyl-CoA:carnitine CoA-transferase CaiB-like acyl-CoA transferase
LRNEKAAKEVYDGLSGLMIQLLGFNPRIALPVLRETKEEIMDEPGTMEVRTERIPTADETQQAQQRANRERFMEARRREAQQQAQPPQPAPVVAPPQASIAPQTNPQSLQRAVQVLGMDDEIGGLASEMLMRQRPA